MRSHARGWMLTLFCGLMLIVALPASAQAIGIEKLVATNCEEEECGEEVVATNSGPFKFTFSEPKKEISVEEAEEEGFTQAGGRVPFGITDFQVASVGSYPEKIPTAGTGHIRTDVAPGLATNPFAVPNAARSRNSAAGRLSLPVSSKNPAQNAKKAKSGSRKPRSIPGKSEKAVPGTSRSKAWSTTSCRAKANT